MKECTFKPKLINNNNSSYLSPDKSNQNISALQNNSTEKFVNRMREARNR